MRRGMTVLVFCTVATALVIGVALYLGAGAGQIARDLSPRKDEAAEATIRKRLLEQHIKLKDSDVVEHCENRSGRDESIWATIRVTNGGSDELWQSIERLPRASTVGITSAGIKPPSWWNWESSASTVVSESTDGGMLVVSCRENGRLYVWTHSQ